MSAGQFGLLGMKERAKLIGAEVSVVSQLGKGTRVHLRVPRRQPADDGKNVKIVNTVKKVRR